MGGRTAKGTLVAGPVQQAPASSKYSNAYQGWGQQHEVEHHASTVADYDFGIYDDNPVHDVELYAHVCSAAVQQERMKANKTQA